MRRSLAKFSESEASNHTPSLADFSTTTPELKFSVHTGLLKLILCRVWPRCDLIVIMTRSLNCAQLRGIPTLELLTLWERWRIKKTAPVGGD